jgi:hypothetical protein
LAEGSQGQSRALYGWKPPFRDNIYTVPSTWKTLTMRMHRVSFSRHMEWWKETMEYRNLSIILIDYYRDK